MTPQEGEQALHILRSRGGELSTVTLLGGREVAVRDVAWGRDPGADFDHVSANVSPPSDLDFHFFETSEIVRIHDPQSGRVLFEVSSLT